MRYLLLTLIILAGITLGGTQLQAVTGEDVRFDWVLGEPAITDDPTSVCDDTAVARFDWSLGEPTIVFDATATCTAVAAPTGGFEETLIIFE